MSTQIKSKERVAERGEVFTAEREVQAMLYLVAPECLRPDSRFLEPACGDGNFLIAILERKLSELRRKHKGCARNYERMSILAIGSLYGVDIMQDNVEACRNRLFDYWNKEYHAHCKSEVCQDAIDAARFIIDHNIVCGNALTLMCVDENGNDTRDPIVFSEWALIGESQMQRSDYTFADLLLVNDTTKGANLFNTMSEEEKREGTFLKRYVAHYKTIHKTIQ